MEFKYWLWIIIGIVYLLSSLRKKQAKPSVPERTEPRRDQEVPVPEKTMTFEELLKEIMEGKEHKTNPTPPKPASKPRVKVGEQIGKEEEDLEDVNYDYRKRDKIYDVYESAKKEAFNRPSLEETLKLQDTDTKFGRFAEFEQSKQRDLIKEYLGDFQDKEGLKKAFIASEILQRKF